MLGGVLNDEFTGSGDYSRQELMSDVLSIQGERSKGHVMFPLCTLCGFKRKSGPRAYCHLCVVPETLQSPCSWTLTRCSPHMWHASKCFKC